MHIQCKKSIKEFVQGKISFFEFIGEFLFKREGLIYKNVDYIS